jgi:ribosomal protection tetracycline resistance protein
VEFLAEHDDALLAAYVEGDAGVPPRRLREALAAQTTSALVYPVFCGSALTGAGVEALTAGIVELLRTDPGDPDGPVAGTVFKIERGSGGDKIAYLRLFSGTVRTRDRVRFGVDGEGKVTAIGVFDHGGAVQRPAVSAGQIAKVWGLAEVRIGDRIGDGPARAAQGEFPPPTLEAVVAPVDPDDAYQLSVALEQLAEQDPLIGVRQDGERRELTVSLYGEVQKEVIEATLASDFGLRVVFLETTPIYVERPLGTGAAVEVLHAESNPYLATIGLRVERAADGSGIEFRLAVDTRTIPLYIYKTAEAFRDSMEQYARHALREGLYGWQVTDCVVTMTRCTYSVPDGPPSRRGPLSTAADFRKLTPLVLKRALAEAGTVVCEPTVHAAVDVPAAAIGGIVAALIRLGASVETPSVRASMATIESVLPAQRADELQRQLSGLTRGEGALDSTFAGYQPVSGEPPTRRRGPSAAR